MKKKLLSILLVLAMFTSLLPVTAMAEEPESALPEVVNGVITLTEDVVLAEPFVVGEGTTLTIDLNGKTVSMIDSSGASCYMIQNNGNLTIKDSSATEETAGTGTLTFKSTTPDVDNNAYSTSTVGNAGTLTVESGTIENTTAGGPSYAIDNYWYTKDVSLTINGGSFEAPGMAVRQVPFSTTYKNVVTVNGGTFTGSTAGLQTYNYADGATLCEVHINGGIFNGTYAFYTQYQKATAHAGTSVEISGGIFNGYIYIYNKNASSSETSFGKVSITGGTFNNAVNIYTKDAGGNKVSIAAITGGSFKVDPSTYLVDGYTATSSNGVYEVAEDESAAFVAQINNGVKYLTLQAAIAAAKAGDTITLLAAVTISEKITITDDLTIDGNNNTLTYTGSDRVFQITGGTVEIKNLTVEMPNAQEGNRGVNLYNGVTKDAIDVTLNKVTVNGGKAYAVNFGGGNGNKLTINNCELNGYAALNVSNDPQNHTIEINASKLNGTNHNNDYHYGVVVLDGENAHTLTIDDATVITKTNKEGVTSAYYDVVVGGDACTVTVPDSIEIAVRCAYNGLYYVSFAGAVNEAKEGGTIKLTAGVTVSGTVDATGKTINQNGKTITLAGGAVLKSDTELTVGTVAGYQVTTSGTYTYTSTPIAVSSVTLDQETLSLTTGTTGTLKATVAPADALNKTVTWTSSNTNVATVSNGTVTAVAAGTATITATVGGKSASCTVTVTQPVTGVTLNTSTLSLVKGATGTLTATITPADATNKTVTWTSSNSSVATVSNGTVTAMAAGTATITATVGDKSASCTVTVTNPVIAVTGVTLNRATLSLTKGTTGTLSATVTPTDATNKTVTWTSSNSSVATVSNGTVTAVAAGTATITATVGGKSASCTVTVTQPVTRVTLNRSTLELTKGYAETLTATVTPADATNKTVTWTSSDTSVATVNSNGKVTAVAAGTATITATADGKSDTCTVIVSNPYTGGSSSNNTSSSTEKNPDGSTTTTTTNKVTGTIMETTKAADGTSSVTKIDADGNVTEIKATVPTAAAKEAAKNDEPVTLPVQVEAAKSSDKAVEISVNVPTKGATVEIPVEDVTPGTVVVIVNKDGTETIVPTSTLTEDGVVVTLDEDATIKVVDNSKNYSDVADNYALSDSIDFVSARGLFEGNTATTFNPHANTTVAQTMTVLARLSGKDFYGAGSTTKGAAWAAEKGLDDGTPVHQAVTRQQMVVMMWKLAGSPDSDYPLTATDSQAIAADAVTAMQWALEMGILKGNLDGTINPNGNASRAHVAAFAERYVNAIA